MLDALLVRGRLESMRANTDGARAMSDVEAFPKLGLTDPSKDLTLIVPAYKEEMRLPKMMEETLPVLREMESEEGVSWEIVIVDDGSSDDTSGTAVRFTEELGPDLVRVCRLQNNRGKGGAVKMGMLRGRGKFLLMIDADGATAANEISNIYRRGKELRNDRGFGVVVGSRAAAATETGESKASRDSLRRFTQWGMHMAVRFVGGVHGIQDTQCGFKLFTRASAALVFPPLHIERWAFDVEVLYLATAIFRMPTLELPVEWMEIEGSHLEVVSASLQIIRDMLATRVCYLTGIWSHKDTVTGSRI